MLNLSAGDEPPEYKKYIDALIKKLWDAGEAPETDPNLIRAYGKQLGDAIIEGYGSKLADLAWDSPDYKTLVALQNNAWQFSAAKTSRQLRDMNNALIGPDGKIRSFNDFKIEAQNIAGQQLNWLRTEYDSAIAGAQMAAKWQTIQETKDTFPLLEFDAVIDDRTSTICRPLDKVTLPVDDPFWDKYYPPNHFNCRSTVRQLRSGKATPKDDIAYPEQIPDNFKFNVGKKGRAFPDDADYYKDMPPHLLNNATLYMPEDEQYIVKYEAEDGTQLQVNRKTDIEKGPDYDNLLTVGKVLADAGIIVDILPEIHANETELRNELLPGVKGDKNPDLTIGGEYAEMKTPAEPITSAAIQKRIADAAKQADKVVILLTGDYGHIDLAAIAKERFKRIPNITSIIFVTNDGEYTEYNRD